jgi:hypothetical protein
MNNPLDPKDIESELSYAYLHAVASAAGVNCGGANRHTDNRGIDATLTCYEKFADSDSWKEEIDLKIQLKATIKNIPETGTHFSYFFTGVKQYDFLREETRSQHRLLIVLFLPPNRHEWLNVSTEELVLRNCAYWVSLRSADVSSNTTGTTVYIPKEQVLTPDNLLDIFKKLSKNEPLAYQIP